MTLVIVDMQPCFNASRNKRLIKNIVGRVKRAKKKYDPVVVVEYLHYGETHPAILNELSSYNNYHKVVKIRCDGSDKVVEKLGEIGIDTKRFTVVGVQADWCVRETAEGLFARTGIPVELPKTCINECSSNKRRNGMLRWVQSDQSNLVIV